jgi:S1-C subfamily serine protease
MGHAQREWMKKTARRGGAGALIMVLLLIAGAGAFVYLRQGGDLQGLKGEEAQRPSAQDIEAVKARAQQVIFPVSVRWTDAAGATLTQQGSLISLGGGDFMTAAHVVQARGEVSAIQARVAGEVYALAVVETSADRDVSKLRAAGHTRWPGVVIAKRPLVVGEDVFIAGYPEKYAGVVAPELIVTSGQVVDVSFETDLVGVRVIKATAKTDRGGSGGAMLNRDGELCGVVVAASSAQDKTTYVYAVPYE